MIEFGHAGLLRSWNHKEQIEFLINCDYDFFSDKIEANFDEPQVTLENKR